MTSSARSSSGHKLGQMIGDWFEKEVALYLLDRVANELALFLDHRFKSRTCRGAKIKWENLDGDAVDFDFVLELGGTDEKKGIPLAFFETFWRRGSRHSMDKVRDDGGKLKPMRDTYPTVRVLGVLAAGDLTKPAQEKLRSDGIRLHYIPKTFVCSAWESAGIQVDYPDKASEVDKNEIAHRAIEMINKPGMGEIIFRNLVSSTDFGMPVIDSIIQQIIAQISAIPIEYKITRILVGQTIVFSNYEDAKGYLRSPTGEGGFESETQLFRYQVIFNDGNMFEREDLSPEEALALHDTVGAVAEYFTEYQLVKQNKSIDR